MKKSIRLLAVLLPLLGNVSANRLLASTGESAANGSQPASAELSQLAAELAETAARLAKLQESQPATPANSLSDESTTTTVRWLGSPSTETQERDAGPSQLPLPEVDRAAHTQKIAPRPAARAYREEPTALAMPTQSNIVTAQANEDIYFMAQAPDQGLQPALEGIDSPQPTTDPALPSDVQWGDPVICGAGGNCCDSCCGPSCCAPGCCCQRCKPPCILVAGVEAVFLSPHINGTPVFYRYDDFLAPEILQFGPAFNNAALDDFYVAPRMWLGLQGCRWGIVGRYYHLRAGEHDHDPFVSHSTGYHEFHSFDVNSVLEAYYADIELTRNFCLHGCKNQFTFGARYALIEHHEAIYGRSVTDPGDGDESLLEGYARRNRQAHGTGLTMSLNGRKPLFPCSCAHWFYNVRSSILWGCSHNEVESEASVITGGSAVGIAGSIDGAEARVNEDLFIGEIQVGLQWDFALRCLPAKAFFRTAFEYQYWDASRGGALSGSFAGVQTTIPSDHQVSTGSYAPGLIVDFVGLSIGSGFTW